MTDANRPEHPEPVQVVVHKASRDCPIVEPHPSTVCGIVWARRRAQAAADVSPDASGDADTGVPPADNTSSDTQ